MLNGSSYSHGLNTIRRDLKPGNTVIDSQGRAKIGDFWLATEIQNRFKIVRNEVSANENQTDSSTLTRTGGTAFYMAPESKIDSQTSDEGWSGKTHIYQWFEERRQNAKWIRRSPCCKYNSVFAKSGTWKEILGTWIIERCWDYPARHLEHHSTKPLFKNCSPFKIEPITRIISPTSRLRKMTQSINLTKSAFLYWGYSCHVGFHSTSNRCWYRWNLKLQMKMKLKLLIQVASRSNYRIGQIVSTRDRTIRSIRKSKNCIKSKAVRIRGTKSSPKIKLGRMYKPFVLLKTIWL